MGILKFNESQFLSLIQESVMKAVENILTESPSLKSRKLQAIFKEHGGLYKDIYLRGRHTKNYVNTDLHNMRDEDILGVMSQEEINQLQKGHDVDHWRWADNFGLDVWAKNNGVQLKQGDRIETEKLADGMFLVFLEHNAEFEHSGRNGEGYESFFNKREMRRKNSNHDGKNEYVPMTPKSKAAHDLRTNPYFRAASQGTLKDRQSGWNDPNRRKQAMQNAHQGKDVWGYDMN